MRGVLLLGLALLLGILALVSLPEHGPVAVEAAGPDAAAVDALVDGLLIPAGLSVDRRGEAPFSATFRPPGAGALADRLVGAAAAAGVEVYRQAVDEEDVALRIYAGAGLRYSLTFLGPRVEPGLPPIVANRRERPAIAVVVGGLGAAAAPFVAQAAPLSLGVLPHSAFALRIALGGMRHHHEILADLRQEPAPPAAALADLPWAAGLLSHPLATALPALPLGVVVHARGSAPPLPEDMDRLPIFTARPGVVGAWEELGRAQRQAVAEGVGALLVEADDPELARVLAWMAGAEAEGWRLVLASEAARPEALVGPPATLPAGAPETPPQDMRGTTTSAVLEAGAVRSSP